jgi:Ca2+-transporting ATPase
MLELVHDSVRGRIRFKVKGLYRDRGFKAHLEGCLPRHSGVAAATASTATGNLLVRYNSAMTPSRLAGLVQQAAEEFRRKHVFPSPAGSDSAPLSLPAASAKKTLPSHQSKSTPKKGPAAGATGKAPAAPVTSPAGRDVPWHAWTAANVLEKLETPLPGGLAMKEATDRLTRYGPNALPPAEPRSGWSIFVEQFRSGPVAMLAAAAAVSVATGGLIDAVAIMSVVGINAVIGYTTETSSERIIHSLKNLITPRVPVLREGKVVELDVRMIVPGDLIALRPGHYVGADARLIEAMRLSIDESALTGESMPVSKSAGCLEAAAVPICDRTNMCYMGTLVTGGQGTAVVVSTGYGTEMGQIQHLVSEAQTPETPMSRQLDRMGNQLVMLSGAMCAAVFLLGLFRGTGFLQMLNTSLALAVAAIPEGLPAVATTTLSLGISEMRKKGVLIRHLGAIEALGATQVICLDKTGTITANRMTVAEIHAGRERIVCTGGQCLPPGTVISEYFQREVAALLAVAALCNESEIVSGGEGYLVSGTPTENALAWLAINNGLDIYALKARFPLKKMFHRAENRNFMVSVHDMAGGGQLTAIKGSPSEVLSFCSHCLLEGQVCELAPEQRHLIQKENERMAGDALRVLGAAYRIEPSPLSGDELDAILQSGLIWTGLVGMTDPIREGTPELMRRFHRAGIKTVMITGDQSATAFRVGKSLNLNGGSQLNILDSSSFAGLGPEMLASLSEQTNIFSRVSPAHKLQIVEAYQRSGKVVAMTGDGINDGPALKKADIGIAMGRTGTDVAREIADVVLEDDDLETMIVAVRHGRTIYLNVRKAVHFLLSTNFSEILVSFAATATGIGQPLSHMQLLWINMITDIFPGLALSLEPPEDDILLRPPRDPQEPIIRRRDLKKIGTEAAIMSLGALGSYGYGIARYGPGTRAGSLAFLSLTWGQLLHALHCRSDQHGIFEASGLKPNRYLKLALGGSFALQLLAMIVPGLRSLLGIQRIGLADVAVIGAGATIPLLINDMNKRARRAKETTP